MIYKYLETYINIEIMDDNGDKCFCLMVSFFLHWRIRTAVVCCFFYKFVDKAHEYPL